MATSFSPYIKRFLISTVVAMIFVGIINEIAHLLQKDENDRSVRTIELVIPKGTADLIAAGLAEASIPTELNFVIGDTLLVHNHDLVPHELGPIFIPANSTASLVMEDANKYTLGCTFQPSRYLDFNVNSHTTMKSRIQAFGLATPPTMIFLFIYSLLVFPLNNEQKRPTLNDQNPIQS